VTLERDSVNAKGLKTSNIFRVVSTALVLSTLSFAAGVAGDLSMGEPPNHGVRVVVRIPPELPEDTPRAAPIALLSTPAAEAREERPAVRRRLAQAEPAQKPPREQSLAAPPKEDPDLAPKAG
jgi:hypothetical protein